MNKSPISVLLLATLPDNGIKSLGSKSLFRLKDKLLIDYQLEHIASALKNVDYDITILCGFDHQRVQRALSGYENRFPLKIIKHVDNNINFVGSFLTGISCAKYDNILSINYGCIFTKRLIQTVVGNASENTIAITKHHSLNENIKIGCHIDDKEIINIFFNLGIYKYLDINLWSAKTISYIKQNFLFDDHKNKFMFEIINKLIGNNHSFNYANVDPYECMLIDNLKMLTKSKRMFINVKTHSKKTKH